VAYRIKFQARASRQIGAARTWYESQQTGLGEEFVLAVELQLKRLEQAPLLYVEVFPQIRRALLPRFPYAIFFAVIGEVVQVISVWHQSSNPKRWP
jgi:toxin ParE1/3/4